MTERRPAHERVPDFVERQILEAQARGEFDDLPGAGRPLDDRPLSRDELWWVKRKLREEHVTDLPPALRAARDRDVALAEALAADDEATVRRIVGEVNERIRRINRTAWYGPPTATGPLDVDEVVQRWWQQRGRHLPPVGDAEAGDLEDAVGADDAVDGVDAVERRRTGRRWLPRRRRDAGVASSARGPSS